MTACGAKTRSGGACRRARVPGRPRCHLHGGKSRAWFFHPRFKHGRYSKYSVERLRWRADRRSAAFIRDLRRALERLPPGEISWPQLRALAREVREYHRRRGWFVR